MKHLLRQSVFAVCLLLLCKNSTTYAQNLVSNGSFETIIGCPPHWSLWDTDYLALASGWHSFGDTPDLFHTCNNTTVGVPLNHRGFEPAFDGSAYAGIATWTYYGINYREFIGQPLATSLQKDVCYKVSFRISLSDSSRQATNGIGARFTNNGAYDSYTHFPIDNSPHLFCDSVIHEKQGWQTLTWFFVPDSTYSHLVIGNFFDDAHTQVEVLTEGGIQPVNVQTSYYYIDAVSVELSDSCGFTAGLTSPLADAVHFAWTVPGSGEISVNIPSDATGMYDLSVTDALGQMVFRETGESSSDAVHRFPVQGYGLYVVRLTTGEGQLVQKVLVSP